MEKEKLREKQLELLVVVMLGITAILTAWASWISSVHGANSTTNYAKSNNFASEGNSEYNAGAQYLMQDMLLYNEINNLSIDLHFAEKRGDSDAMESLEWKIDELIEANMSEALAAAYINALEESEALGRTVSPFEDEAFLDSYFITAMELLEESEEALAAGQKDSADSDAFGLATVIYTVALFMLGITNSFKDMKSKIAVFGIAIGAFLIATIYMLFLPMPTDFNILSFFTSQS